MSTGPLQLTFSQIVEACVGKGWGQGDQSKMMREFRITRAMADQVVDACENWYVEDHRAKWADATPDRPFSSSRRRLS